MATRAVLPEDAGSFVFMLLSDVRGGVPLLYLRGGWSTLRRRLRERSGCGEQYEGKEDALRIHDHLPFQAGVRNR